MNNVHDINKAARYFADPANRERRERPAILSPLTRTTHASPAVTGFAIAGMIAAAAIIGALLLKLFL